MYKSIFAILLVGLLLAGPALAGPPPAHGGYPGGWGNNPTKWDDCTGFYQDWALYDASTPPSCAGWNVFEGGVLQGRAFVAPMSIQLWVELYAEMTIYMTHTQFHQLGGDGDDFTFYFGGVVASNNSQQICVTGNGMPLTHLRFQHDIFGNEDPYASNWAVSYYIASGQGNDPPPPESINQWTSIEPEQGRFCWEFPKCDWWFWIKGHFCIEYHEHDGYYLLSLLICPMPYL